MIKIELRRIRNSRKRFRSHRSATLLLLNGIRFNIAIRT